MRTYQERYQDNTLKNEPILVSDISYFRQRFRNGCYQAIMSAFAEKARASGITKQKLAEILGKDPAQISRIFSGPGNWTLDTLSDLSLALGREPEITLFDVMGEPEANYIHEWSREYVRTGNIVEINSAIPYAGTTSSANQLVMERVT